MNRKRSLIRGGAVLVVAVAAGHLVQTLNMRQTAEAPAPQPEAVELASASGEAPGAPLVLASGIVLPELRKLPPLPQTAALPVALTDPAGVPAEKPAAVAPPTAAVAVDCTPDLVLSVQPGALLAVELTATCHAGGRVVLRHAGLAIAEALDASGRLVLDLPALDVAGQVSALLPDASIASAEVAVPDAARTRRYAVQWMADDAFQLQGYENGAGWGAKGHVNVATPVSPSGAYMMALGNPTLDLPMMAEVYTFPAGDIPATAVIEAGVTDLTCGRELLGETIASEGGVVTVTDLTLAMPDCDALGDILVLNNLSPDVTLAAAD